MRGISRATLIFAAIAMLAVLAVATVSPAATSGGGTVVGTVVINGSGIPTLNKPCEATSYNFGAVNITGVFHSTKTFIGTIKIPAGVSGGAGCENTNKGSGSVNPFSFSGSGSGTIDGVCGGSFTRNISIVIVKLDCNTTIGGVPGHASVAVYANFTPTKGNGITTRTTAASFAGIYKSS